MQLSGAQIIVQSLKAEGVEYVFGYPGGAVIEIYDALFQLNKFKHILVRHEQAAVHAADAYARVSGKVGVALVTSGPGVTNALTGIATAYSDSIPLVVISGQVGNSLIGTDAFQEVDTVGITRPCVKHNFLVTNIAELADTIKKAFQIAASGRPGPVVVDIPKDVTQAMAKFSYPQEDIFIRSYQPVVQGHIGQIKKAVQMLASAKRPIIYFGGGVVLGNASEEMTKFVRIIGAPCTGTLMGLGAYPSSDRQFLGMLGMHGTYEANLAMQNADVVLAIGARFDDRVISVPSKFFEKAKKIIHIDVDPSSIAKRVKVDIPIVGDVKNVLSEMIQLWGKQESAPAADSLDKWWKSIEEWRSRNCLWFDNESEIIKPQYVIQKLAEITNNSAIITSDVGQHQMFTAQYYPFERPRQWLNSGGLGTMGVGLPYALGAKLAAPEQDVFCITGEGSIQMNIQELSTCFQYNVPINVVTLNNGYLGMVRQWQTLFYDGRYSNTHLRTGHGTDRIPDFVKLGDAYGCATFRCERDEDVDETIKQALAINDRPVVIDFTVSPDAMVWPMVPAGVSNDLIQIAKNTSPDFGREEGEN